MKLPGELGITRITVRNILLLTPLVVFALCAGILVIWFGSACVLPVRHDTFERLCNDKSRESIRIFSNDGRLLREALGHSGERMERVPLDRLAPLFLSALIAAEDERFYKHTGIDFFAIVRAVSSNIISHKTVSGASTISMQLARIVYRLPRTFWGKIAQMRQAIWLERALTKTQILELYANVAPFGGNCVGVGAASKYWLGKSASALSVSEAAFLAGLPQAPTVYNPAKYPDTADGRRRYVLARMLETGVLSAREYEAAVNERVTLCQDSRIIAAGHYTDWVLSLNPEPGDIRTTLDYDLQIAVESIVADHVSQFEGLGLTNAAAVVLDVTTGGVLAMVGSREWSDPTEGAVNGVLARRQPGSALKPFMYELAFELGAAPNDLLADIETEYYGADKTLYIPKNYSETFRGPVLAAQALACSLNVPAIRLLNEKVGLESFLQRLRALGFAGLTKSPETYGLGIVLGSGEVSPLELAGAYAALARGGLLIHPTPFIVEPKPTRIMDEQCAWLVTAILSDEFARMQAFGPTNPLLFGFPFAVKTGTSSNWKDSWTAGYNNRYAVVVWGGDFGSKPMEKISGSSGSGYLFNRIVRYLVERDRGVSLLPLAPAGVGYAQVCSVSGKLPTKNCGSVTLVPVRTDVKLGVCDVHTTVLMDARTNKRAEPGCPARYVYEEIVTVLPPIFDRWLASAGYAIPKLDAANNPEPGAIGFTAPVTIAKPRTGDVFIIEPGYDISTQTVEFVAIVNSGIKKITWLVDDRVFAESTWPFTASWQLEKGYHVIVAKSDGYVSDPVRILVK